MFLAELRITNFGNDIHHEFKGHSTNQKENKTNKKAISIKKQKQFENAQD